MERKFTIEEKEKIVNFGAFGYEDPEMMANILDWDTKEVVREMKKKRGQWQDLYKKGRDRSTYAVDMKLLDMAMQGDMKAIEEIERRKFERS